MRRIIAGAIAIIILCACALAEEPMEHVYVLCHPGSYVNGRIKPKVKSEDVAYLVAGDMLETDGKTKGNWLHVYVLCEVPEAWVNMGYIVEDEPVIYPEGVKALTNARRVRVRKGINGDITRTLKQGTELMVYAVSEEWAVTDYGFIKREFLDIEEPEG